MAKLRTTFAPTPLANVKTAIGEADAGRPSAEIKNKLVAAGFADIQLIEKPPSDPFFIIAREKLVPLLEYVRNELTLEFNFMQVISATDFIAIPANEERAEIKPHMELLYVLYSLPLRSYLNIKVILTREDPTIDTVSHLFRAANWYERECFDLLGITFRGHPHMERILLPPDWVGYPLRKDYVFPEEYNGMKVPL